MWDPFHDLTVTGPTGAAVAAILLCLAAMGALLLLRRMLPSDNQRDGGAMMVSLWIALILDLTRLGLMELRLGQTTLARVMGVLATVLLSLGIVGTVLLVLLDIVPDRLVRRRAPPILHEVILMIAFVIIVIGALGEIQEAKKFTAVVTTSAVLTAVIGLALQSTLSNLFAGLALQMDRALGVDDWVQVTGRTGRIVEIRWRSTLLRTLDGDLVLVPNSKLMGEDVLNHSRPAPSHRVAVKIGVHLRHPPNDVRTALLHAVADVPGVLTNPAPECFPIEFTENSIAYTVRFWVEDFTKTDVASGEVRSRLWYAAKRAGLELPLPIRQVHVQQDDADKRDVATRAERKQRLDVLERVDLFGSLEPSDREVLADGMRRVRFGAGEIILEQGSPGDSLYVIITGTVRVSLSHGVVSRVVASLGPGQCFGEMSLLTGAPRSATCIAQTDVDCYEVGHDALERILTSSPHLAEELSVQLAARQSDLTKQGAALSAEVSRKHGSDGPVLARIRSFFGISD